jgi:REP element-mobilizing transposase RayT
MARKPRIEYKGALYHVISRGNRRETIFKDKQDFQKYMEILARYKKRYQFCLYSYVLMSNHIHLLIETGITPLSKIKQGVNQSYAMYFNRRYKSAGHLFQGRYKAILCDRDTYFLQLIKYIHLNPVRAKMVREVQDYQWSSHSYYVVKGKENRIVDTDCVLRMFSADRTAAMSKYREFMGDGIPVKRDDIYRTIDQRVLGNEAFLENVMEQYDGEIAKKRREREYALSEIASGVERIKGVTLDQMRIHSKASGVTECRKLFILISKEYGYRGKEIADYIGRDPAIISMALKDRSQLADDMERVIRSMRNLNF